MAVGTILTAVAIVSTINDIIGVLGLTIRTCNFVVKKLNNIINKTEDPFLKKHFIQKKELEEKEKTILIDAEIILNNLKKSVEKLEGKKEADIQKELESTKETVDLLKSLEEKIGKLKALKRIKLNVQKKIYTQSKKLKNMKKHTVDLSEIEEEILDLELMLEKEEREEAQLEEFISQLIEKLEEIGQGKTTQLAHLLRDFQTLSKISTVERYVDEQIYHFIEAKTSRQKAA